MQKLVGLVVSDESSSRMRTVAIYGDPEKARRAAIALCYDASVQAAFPDGIVWIDAPSTEKQALEQMREAGKALGDDLQRYDSLVGARHQLHTTISKRNILLILHGASEPGQMEMLTANAPGSALVATTNRLEIADQAGATCDVGETRKVPRVSQVPSRLWQRPWRLLLFRIYGRKATTFSSVAIPRNSTIMPNEL